MSEINPDDPRGGPRHVESTVVGDEHDTSPPPPPTELPPPPLPLPPPPTVESEQLVLEDLIAAPEISSEPGHQQADTQEFEDHVAGADELQAAKYFSIAFMVVIIPLGLIILAMITLAFVRSLDFLK